MKAEMNTLLKRVVVLSAAVLVGLVSRTVQAETCTVDGIEWTYSRYWNDDDGVTITGVGTSIAGDIVIPSSLDGYPVTEISSAFYGCTGTSSVVIPNSVTSIGSSAFSGCTGLSSVTIGNGVTSIGGQAFYGCTKLASVTFKGEPPAYPDSTFRYSFSQETTAEGYYSAEYAKEWEAEIDGNGLWKGLKMKQEKVVEPTPIPEPTPEPTPEPEPEPEPMPEPEPEVEQYLAPDEDGAVDLCAAQIYNGYLYDDEDGAMAGTIQVKAAKEKYNRKTGETTSKLTVTIQIVGEKRKVSIKGDFDVDAGVFLAKARDGRELELELWANGMRGSFGGYAIDGARDIVSSKDKDDKVEASEVLNDLKDEGSMMMAWMDDEGAGWNTLSVTVNAKGKVKVSGSLVDGAKVSVNASLIIGEEWCVIPVVYSKKNISFAFNVWISRDTYEMSVPEFDVYDLVFGAAESFEEEACFCVDIWTFYDLLEDEGTFSDCSPDGVAITAKREKWSLPKAGKVVIDREGELDYDKLGENPAGLKLTYKVKDGTFSGSFSLYQDKNGKPKATTVSVSGVMIDGIGYGTATLKRVGSVPVTIE